jgi:hypothetical protein
MLDRLKAKQLTISEASVAGGAYVQWNPPVGVAFRLIEAHYWHDDVVDRHAEWDINNATGYDALTTFDLVAGGVWKRFYTDVPSGDAWILRHNFYLNVRCDLLGAGKKIYLLLVGEEIVGETPYVA